MGVAVQSHWFSVGSVVTWAEPGVGAVATQAFARAEYGPELLADLRAGASALGALAARLAADGAADTRQVAVVDAAGRAAAHTGARCVRFASHRVGEGFSVQANIMRTDQVVPAMAAAFAASGRALTERLLVTLEAAERAGGDIRGRQSAALLVVDGDASLPAWKRAVELRIEDHPDPLAELRRLLTLHEAYARMDEGDATLAAGDQVRASAAYAAALALAPNHVELAFWHAVTLASNGHEPEARAALAPLLAAHPNWAELLRRLPEAGLLAPAVAARLAVGAGRAR